MAKPNKTTITEALETWAKAKAKALRAEAKRDADIAPHEQRYLKTIAPIEQAAKDALAPLEKTMREAASVIEREMRLGINGDGTIAVPQVATEKAFAKINTKDGDRLVDAQKFFDEFHPSSRNATFWSCVKILVGKAEKAYGDIVNRVSKPEVKHLVEIALKK